MDDTNTVNQTAKTPHYYGDIVRYLFLAAAVIMVLGLPALSHYLTLPTSFSIAGIVVLGLAAGLTNPLQKWAAILNGLIAVAGFIIFETYAVRAFRMYSATDKFFLSNLLLSIIFVFAIYYSVKTVRGLYLNK